jgi:hypothetical protein
MLQTMKNKKFQFWTNWTLLSFGIIPFSYIISLILVLLVHTAFGFSQMEGGTPLSETLMQIAGGAVLGLGTGIYQRSLLRKVFDVSSAWIYTLIIGFAITELTAGIILRQMGLNRVELRVIELRPLPEALIFSCAGLIIGYLQWTILRRYFYRSVYWIIASALGWGICISINILWIVPFIRNSILATVMVFAFGALLYGAITGATLMWIIKPKGIELSDNA